MALTKSLATKATVPVRADSFAELFTVQDGEAWMITRPTGGIIYIVRSATDKPDLSAVSGVEAVQAGTVVVDTPGRYWITGTAPSVDIRNLGKSPTPEVVRLVPVPTVGASTVNVMVDLAGVATLDGDEFIAQFAPGIQNKDEPSDAQYRDTEGSVAMGISGQAYAVPYLRLRGTPRLDWFGDLATGVGTGTEDWSPAMDKLLVEAQAYEELAARIPGKAIGYQLRRPLFLPSGVDLFGDGYNSYLYTEEAAGANAILFSPGWLHEADWAGIYSTGDAWDLDDYDHATDLNIVTTSTAADAGNLSAGQIVYVALIDTTGTPNNAAFAEVREVLSVDGGTGAVTLSAGFTRDLASGVDTANTQLIITTLEGYQSLSYDTYICKGGAIRNLRVSSENGNWQGRSAWYQGLAENIFVQKSRAMIGGNGKAYCTFRGVWGYFFGQVGEVGAEGAHDSLFTDIRGHFIGGTPEDGMIVMRDNCILENFHFTGGDHGWANILRMWKNGGIVRNGRINARVAPTGTGNVVAGASGLEGENVVAGVHFDLLGGGGSNLFDLYDGVEIRGCTFENMDAASFVRLGRMQGDATTSYGSRVTGNRFLTGGTALDVFLGASAADCVFAYNYLDWDGPLVLTGWDYGDANRLEGNRCRDEMHSGAGASYALTKTTASPTIFEYQMGDGPLVYYGGRASGSTNQTVTLPAAKRNRLLCVVGWNPSTGDTIVEPGGSDTIYTDDGTTAASITVAKGAKRWFQCQADGAWSALPA